MSVSRGAHRLLLTALVACGSGTDPQTGGGPGKPDGTSSGSAPTNDPPAPPGPGEEEPGPAPRREFPLRTPALPGYGLRDAFPNSDLDFPSVLVWPKVEGALPFLLERYGRLIELGPNGGARTLLDFSANVEMRGEGGAIGMTLHPQFGDGSGAKPYAYFWYNAKGEPKRKQRLSRFTWNAATKTFDRASEVVMLQQDEERTEHNGGRILFGPDGFLYFGNGDDTMRANHQRLDRALFAGIFRIDVDQRGGSVSHPPPKQPAGGFSTGYFIPNDNPFVGVPGALEEYYALGLRNPFGFSFDRVTGMLWAADVGDTWREEINLIVPGANYEWPYREGDILRGGAQPTIGTARPPIYVYSHAEMADLVAALGGFVYRGKELPELAGKYVYSDWPSGRVWALDPSTTPPTRTTLIENDWQRIPLSIAEDNAGELYVLHVGGIAKLVRDTTNNHFPKRLSETILFKDVAALEPEPSLVAYEINSPLWSDGAAKRRWIRLPEGARVELAADGTLKFPTGTLLVKHFELPASIVPHDRTRRLETRVLVVGSDTVYGVTYRWNEKGTDADLVLEPTNEGIQDDAHLETRSWHYPSSGQCWSCHRPRNRVLGFTPQQLGLTLKDGAPQVETLAAKGVFDPAVLARFPAPLAKPSDSSAPLEARATAYLAANCASCHHPGASYLGGNDTWNAMPGVPLAQRGLLGAPHHNTPMATALGLGNAPLIDPGKPERSILLARVKSSNPDLQMPPLGRTHVDDEGARLLEAWIRSIH